MDLRSTRRVGSTSRRRLACRCFPPRVVRWGSLPSRSSRRTSRFQARCCSSWGAANPTKAHRSGGGNGHYHHQNRRDSRDDRAASKHSWRVRQRDRNQRGRCSQKAKPDDESDTQTRCAHTHEQRHRQQQPAAESKASRCSRRAVPAPDVAVVPLHGQTQSGKPRVTQCKRCETRCCLHRQRLPCRRSAVTAKAAPASSIVRSMPARAQSPCDNVAPR